MAPKPRPLAARLAIPFLTVGTLFFALLALSPVSQKALTALQPFLLPVMVSAWFGGLWPGLAAAFLSLSIRTLLGNAMFDIDLALQETIFALEAICLSFLFQSLHDSKKRQVAANQALRAADERLAHTLRSARMGTWELDLSTGRIDCSPEHDVLFGLRPPEGGWSLDDFLKKVHPDDRDKLATQIRGVLSPRGFTVEFRVITAECGIRWLALRGQVHNQKASGSRISGVTQDITERRQVEADRTHSMLLFRRIAETTPDVLYVFDLVERRMVFCNASTFALLGYAGEVTSADLTFFLRLVHPEDLATIQHDMRNLASAVDGEIVEHELRLKHRLGHFRTLRFRTVVFDRRADGSPWRILGLARDVTGSREAEENLLRAKEAAEAASRSKSAFLANVSHEIRTPLGAILGFSELLKDPALPHQERANYIDVIGRNGRELACLIDDILDLSKVEAGRLEVERIRFSLPNLLADVTTSLSVRAREKAIRLSVESVGTVPDTIVSDTTRLRQILINIIGNAVKFTDHGEVDVVVETTPPKTLPGHQTLKFTIKDSGRGIPEAKRSKLFQAFAQADSSTTRKFGGTGLGLILSRQLARLLGGDVVLAHSELGVGSTFIVTIDAGPVEARPAEPKPTVARQRVDDKPTVKQLDGVRVLLAEDVIDNQILLQRLLTGSGAKVDIVPNGLEAVKKAKTTAFDVILMDIQMPELDGLGATRQLRACGYDRPIIALTAHAMREEREKCLRSGCNDHLTKPVSISTLVQTVAHYASQANPANYGQALS